jgi:hypothetical protein
VGGAVIYFTMVIRKDINVGKIYDIGAIALGGEGLHAILVSKCIKI